MKILERDMDVSYGDENKLTDNFKDCEVNKERKDMSPALFSSSHDIIARSDTLSESNCEVDTPVATAVASCSARAVHPSATQDTPVRPSIALQKRGGSVVPEASDSDTEVKKFASEREEQQYIENMVKEIGFTVDEVKTHVGSVTDKCQQKQLRDTTRNKKIKKTVYDRRRGQRALYCESDDLVVYYDIVSEEFGWFIKIAREQCLSEEEKEILSCLRNWEAITDSSFAESCADVEIYLETVAKLVRVLLG